MARLRYNGLTAALGASLTNSATSVTFAAGLTHSGGTNVPTIAGSDYFMLTILDSAGAVSEIVKVTAYTAAATTATIVRGQEGTTGVAHSSGDKLVHSATVDDVRFIGCRAIRSSTQSITNNTGTFVSFTDADEFDTDAFHSTSTNPTRITIPTGMGGYYRVDTQAFWSDNSNGIRTLQMWKNNTQIPLYVGGSRDGIPISTGGQFGRWRGTSATLVLVDGDYLEFYVEQDSGSTLTLQASMTVQKIG